MQNITMNEYQNMAMRTANKISSQSQPDGLMCSALGLAGESGEFADIVKKINYHDHEYHDNRDELIKELGDVLWYCSLAAFYLNISLSDVACINVEKLKKRYPAGFETERSINRMEDDK